MRFMVSIEMYCAEVWRKGKGKGETHGADVRGLKDLHIVRLRVDTEYKFS